MPNICSKLHANGNGGHFIKSKQFHMSKSLLYVLAVAFSANLFAQTTVTGVLLSGKNKTPIEFAAVYVNGSSRGTTSDKNGYFRLNKVTFPCTLVVSHVSYCLKTVQLNSTLSQPLMIDLDEKAIELGVVSKSGKNQREENIRKFKKYFLGTYQDKWASCARIENEDALYFSRYPDTLARQPDKFDYMARNIGKPIKNTYWKNDSTVVEFRRNVFSTRTKYPLIITLDKMGYKVHIDIEFFNIEEKESKDLRQSGEHIWWNSYSFSVPVDSGIKTHDKEIDLNRREAYFNSMRHFERSLINNTLHKNGFLVSLSRLNKNDTYLGDFDINNHIIRISDNSVGIVGLKSKTLEFI